MKIRYYLIILMIMPASSIAQLPSPVYPKIGGYAGILHPLIVFNKNGSHSNFNGRYIGGMPVGINIWKTPKIGFSMEIVPFIRAENGTSKMNNLLFHPGILISAGNGFTVAGRVAFETSGRYGITPVVNKIIKRNKNTSYFVAVPMPVRFGNNQLSTYSVGFQFGVGF